MKIKVDRSIIRSSIDYNVLRYSLFAVFGKNPDKEFPFLVIKISFPSNFVNLSNSGEKSAIIETRSKIKIKNSRKIIVHKFNFKQASFRIKLPTLALRLFTNCY